MPELPEVETVCRGLRARLQGRAFVDVRQRRRDLRIPFPAQFEKRLKGRRIEDIGRRGKYILVHLDDAAVLLIHLGMSGRMVIGRTGEGELAAHDHAVFDTDDGQRIIFNDHRRFGLMDLFPAADLAFHPLLRDMGPEPLGPAFTVAVLEDGLRGRQTPIKAALLDQHTVAGLGNIYVCEALFRAGISPKRSAATVVGARAKRLVPAIQAVLNEAIAAGGSSLRDYVQTSGELGYFQHRFSVYDREGKPCPKGRGGVVQRIVQSGRSTFYCPKCQR